MMRHLYLILISFKSFQCLANNIDEPTDYCGMLGEDDIQGLSSWTHGFLAGNKVYYFGGRLDHIRHHETLGLTHPFHHDLRSRGTGIVYHEVHMYRIMIEIVLTSKDRV